MNEILNEIKKLNLSDVRLLALITQTSYDVVFYALVDGKMQQSNALAESGKIDLLALDHFYETIFNIVKNDSEFNSAMLNIVTFSEKDGCRINYMPKDAKMYEIKKQWKTQNIL